MDGKKGKKAAFIVCVNDQETFAECLFYLDRLKLPQGFEKDVIAVEDAPSMAAGYNAGMQSSDAEYKIYMHQDVCIINRNFIADICHIFEMDADIGILGCVGATKLGREAMAVTAWNTGKVIHNCVPMLMQFGEMAGDFEEVEALDGLLLATRYDILWREDLMDGWDFYDISQCMEFRRAGYQVVVPKQEKAWCYHDNTSSNMTNYNLYRKRFIDAYASDGGFVMPPVWEGTLEYQKMKQQTVQIMERLINEGCHKQLHEVFQDTAHRKYIHLREYESIADIDYLEGRAGSEKRLWQDGMSVGDVLSRFRTVKRWVKRIEHQAEDTAVVMGRLVEAFSVYAVIEVFMQYVEDKADTYHRVKQYYRQEGLKQELSLWELSKGQ